MSNPMKAGRYWMYESVCLTICVPQELGHLSFFRPRVVYSSYYNYYNSILRKSFFTFLISSELEIDV